MKLSIYERSNKSKACLKKIRSDDNIPAILYCKGEASQTVFVKRKEFYDVLRHVDKKQLSTTVFEMTDEGGKKFKAIVKDIQYNIISYDVLHLDFLKLLDDTKVNVKIPIMISGAMECAGIKLGGMLRQVIDFLKVSCFPKDLPVAFELNVKNLGIKQSLRLKDIDFPDNVKPMMNLNEVAVVIAKGTGK
jgi:large subunit ribosomal protein L25